LEGTGPAALVERGLRLLGIVTRRPLVGPQIVSLEVTHACNLRCSFCESHGSCLATPITARRTYAGDRRTMSTDTVASLCRSLARMRVGRVELSGKGDPIAHPELAAIVRIIKGAGLDCSLVTNGTLARPDLAATLVECGLDRLSLSLNAGTREVYARVSGKDLWDRALSILREVLARRRASGARRPHVRATFVLCRDNAEDFDAAVGLMCDLRVDAVTAFVMGELPETAHLQLDEAQARGVLAAIPGWSRRLEAAGIAHDLPNLARDLPLRVGARAPQENPLQRGLPCYEGWVFTVVGPDGTVVPCCYCEDLRLGNVVEEDFARLWTGPRYADYRRRSLEMSRTQRPICWECYTTCNRALNNQRIHRRLGFLRPA